RRPRPLSRATRFASGLPVDRPQAPVCGMRVAEKITVAALEHSPGVYLITPFLYHETTTELAKFARSLCNGQNLGMFESRRALYLQLALFSIAIGLLLLLSCFFPL